MRKLITCLLLASYSLFLSAQDVKRIFNDEQIIFYGLDFSKAKMAIPDDPKDVKDNFFGTWNEMVMVDNQRFNKESALQKIKVPIDLTVVERRNAATSISDM